VMIQYIDLFAFHTRSFSCFVIEDYLIPADGLLYLLHICRASALYDRVPPNVSSTLAIHKSPSTSSATPTLALPQLPEHHLLPAMRSEYFGYT